MRTCVTLNFVPEGEGIRAYSSLNFENLSVRTIEKTLLSASAGHFVPPKSGVVRKLPIL